MFVTGVTKFAQASIFSVFNNLNDLTLNPEFNGICGFTMEEFETYCADYLPGVLDYQKANGWLPSTDTINDLKKQIMAQYDGYSWNGIDRVLNPFSLIKFLEIRKLLPFWFNTGTPSFLLEFIKGHLLEFTQTENYIMTEDMFGAVDVANLELVPLLFQTGYLTIENFDSPQEYSLKWPNFEVDRAFNVNLLKFLTGQSKKSIDNLRNKIRTALMNIDRDSITECFQDILLWFPFQLHLPFEAFYHAIIFSVLKSFHYEVEAEVSVAEGIYDMSIEIPNGPFYVCEFKYAKIEEKDGKTGAKDGKTEEKGGRSEEKDGRSEEKSSQIILAETLEAIKTRLKSEKFAEKVDHLLTRALDQAKNQIKNRRYEAKARCEKPIVKRMAVAVVGRTDVLVEIY
jgi:hypothetical protein